MFFNVYVLIYNISILCIISICPCIIRCKKNNQLYTCPRCGIKYCGLECYKSEAHLDCSESFYKQCVTDELKSQQNDPDDRQKMLEILQRVQEADLEAVLEDNEEADDICNDEDYPLDSDDEEVN